MNRREFVVATLATFALPHGRVLPVQALRKLTVSMIGSMVFSPGEDDGRRKIVHLALMNHGGHSGHLILEKDNIESASISGRTPTKAEFGRWRLPGTDPLKYADYLVWAVKGSFNIDVTATAPAAHSMNKLVSMSVLGGPFDEAGWRAKTWAHTTLRTGMLSDATPRSSGLGHDVADFKFEDDKGKQGDTPKKLTDVVEYHVPASTTPPRFELGPESVVTKKADSTAWLIQTRDEPDAYAQCNEARHCEAYFELMKSPIPAASDRKIPRRVISSMCPPDSDPVFCPPGMF